MRCLVAPYALRDYVLPAHYDIQARNSQRNDVASRCLSIIYSLQADATLPLPAKTLLHALRFAVHKLGLTGPVAAYDQFSSDNSTDLRATNGVDCCELGVTATHASQPAGPSVSTPKQAVSDCTEERSEVTTVKLSKAARRRRNRKARLAPYLRPILQTGDSPVATNPPTSR